MLLTEILQQVTSAARVLIHRGIVFQEVQSEKFGFSTGTSAQRRHQTRTAIHEDTCHHRAL